MYLTAADAGKRVGLTPAAIRAAAKDGRLNVAVETESGRRFFTCGDVDEFDKARLKKKRG